MRAFPFNIHMSSYVSASDDPGHSISSRLHMRPTSAQTEQSSLSALRKHAYSNIIKILPANSEIFPLKILIFFIFLLKT